MVAIYQVPMRLPNQAYYTYSYAAPLMVLFCSGVGKFNKEAP